MKLTVNGTEHNFAGVSLSELLEQLEISTSGVAVAVNGKIIRRQEHQTHLLQEGDSLMVITATYGG